MQSTLPLPLGERVGVRGTVANLPMSAEVAQLAALLDACTRAVVFTGAGISTESGIPDFRSPGGL